MKIAINGFGRIGRQFLQAALEKGLKAEWVINDLSSADNLAYLLKRDSIQKGKNIDVETKGNNLVVNKKIIKVFNEKNIESLPWAKEKVDIVAECTGIFTKREDAEKHLKAGAKKVLISAPGKNTDVDIIYGINEKNLKPQHKIISALSCTTNCVVPMAHILNNNFKIEQAFMITVHAYTADQKLVDTIHHKDWRRGRAAAYNIVPTTTGAAKCIGEAIPELKGKVDGYAVRVPVLNGSYASIIATLKKAATIESINNAFKKAASKELKEILEYTEEPIVSSDIIHNSKSCIFDALMTRVQGNLVNICGWYDNEWGYSCRMVDVVKLISKKL